MTKSIYKQPPITEAVIEIRFASPIDESVYNKLNKKISDFYPDLKPINTYKFDVKFEGNHPNTTTTYETDYRFSSSDMSQILILKNLAVTVSQLAPYESWEKFTSRFQRDFALLKKHTGHREITRIGVRYINRVDIPNQKGEIVHEDQYVNIYPQQPENLNPVNRYAIQSQLDLKDIKAVLTLNSAVIPSPLKDHSSIVVDQDIAKEIDVPQSAKDIVDYLEIVRTKKNSVFESCITDKARELFNKCLKI